MKKIVVSMVITAYGLFAQTAALPTGESIFDRYVEVTGGKAAYAKRTSEVSKGSVVMAAAGVTGTVEIYAMAPNFQTVIMDVQGVGRVEQGTNGAAAWELSAVMGPRLKQGKEKDEALREALFNLPLHWRKIYSKLQTEGSETTEGIDCYRVAATPSNGGKPELFWFDKATGFTVKVKRTVLAMDSEIPAELVMKDYKLAGLIKQPMTMIQRVGGQEVQIRLQTVTPNAVIPKTRFAPPADIQQLMKKPAA